jgi:hypothetical protein
MKHQILENILVIKFQFFIEKEMMLMMPFSPETTRPAMGNPMQPIKNKSCHHKIEKEQ